MQKSRAQEYSTTFNSSNLNPYSCSRGILSPGRNENPNLLNQASFIRERIGKLKWKELVKVDLDYVIKNNYISFRFFIETLNPNTVYPRLYGPRFCVLSIFPTKLTFLAAYTWLKILISCKVRTGQKVSEPRQSLLKFNIVTFLLVQI